MKRCICDTATSTHDDYCPLYEAVPAPIPASAHSQWVVVTTHRELPLQLGAGATQELADRYARYDMTLLIGEEVVSVRRAEVTP